MTLCLNGILVTDDQDLTHLPFVPTGNWLAENPE